MRRILVNRARDKARQKRGGGRVHIRIDNIQLAMDTPCDLLLALDEALVTLQEADGTAAKLVELRFFAGLSHGEAARALGLPRRTADRYWAYARSWLFSQLTTSKTTPQNPQIWWRTVTEKGALECAPQSVGDSYERNQ